jgi:Protein of unknown function (DUF3306)
MSEQDEFLARWMRLKQRKDDEAQPKTAETQRAEVGQSSPPAPIGSESAGIAPASPRAVESITDDGDIRPFLQLDVPTELVRAALRAAWATDPAIRDFVGIAESQWDFNDPTAMPGFGPLAAAQSEQSVIRPSVSPLDGAPDGEERKSEIVNPQRDGQVDKVWLSSSRENRNPGSKEVIGRATHPREDNADSRPRRHGSALPR